MKRVTHVIGGGEFGGAEEHILQLSLQLKAAGWEPHVICFYRERLAQQLKEVEIDVDVLESKRYDVGIYNKLKQSLILKPPLLIHTHGVKANLWGRLLGYRLGFHPIVTTVHSFLSHDYTRPLSRYAATCLEKGTRPLSHHFIAISKAIKAELIQAGLPSSKIKVIHHGIDTRRFSPGTDSQAAELARSWGKKEGLTLIGAIGRITPVKNFALFVQACASLNRQYPGEYAFVLVGDGAQRSELEQLVRAYQLEEIFTFAGFREDIPLCLKAIDIYMCTSWAEGLSLTLLEAMASGKPVVTMAVGGMREIVYHEQNGLLVPRHDVAALVHEVIKLREPRLLKQITERAVCDVKQQFSVQKMAQETMAQYEQWLLSQRTNTLI